MVEKDKRLISGFIVKGRTQEAVDYLLTLDLPAGHQKEIAQIAASFTAFKQDQIKGVLSFDQERLERNRINSRLLDLINQPIDQPLPTTITEKKATWWKYLLGISVIVGILGALSEFTGKNLSDLVGGPSPESFTVTVFVHGKAGRHDRILKNQGQVMLGLRGNEMPSSINEKGEATFKEISPEFIGQKVPIRIEHPQPYRAASPDSLYLLGPNAAIYVEIALEGTKRIFGKVMDFDTETWLDSVRVSIENEATYTDQFGWFELNIPEDKQRKFQRVSFFKKGYNIEELDSIPVHTQREIQISLRKSKK